MQLYPTQQLSSNSSSPILASPGTLSWGGGQSCWVGDCLWVSLFTFHSLQL